MTDTTQAKTPARAYAESIVNTVAAKYISKKLVESMVAVGLAPDEMPDEAVDETRKGIMLDAGNLLHLKMLFESDFPHRPALLAAILPPLLDTGKMDDCVKAGKEGEGDRKNVRRITTVGVNMLDEMIRVYTHELSHLTAGESFGAKGAVAVIVMPEMRQVGDEGYGVAMNLSGGRCKFNGPLTPEQRAVINVAGHMGEKLCTSIKGMGEDAARDTDYWLKVFADIHAAGDPDKAEGEDKKVFHSGAWADVSDFYMVAPTEEERRTAIAAAGEIIIDKWMDILAAAAYRAIQHLTTMGDVLTLMTTAMDMAEAAATGTYGQVGVTVINVPKDDEEAE